MFEPDTEVVVIGNGPAGISLSAFLSGWLPYYSLSRPHPDAIINENLSLFSDSSLIDQDLSWYHGEYMERASPSVGMYSDLLDHLMRPEHSDHIGKALPSCLDYYYHPERRISHIVLGDSTVGGSWNRYDDNMATVSLCTWMNLPGYSLTDFLGGQSVLARLPAGLIREYFKCYVQKMGLTNNFAENTTVTNVMKFCADADGREYWRVQGKDSIGRNFEITCKRLVLACGRNHHRLLDVDGENNAMNLVYTAKEMRQVVHEQEEIGSQMENDGELEGFEGFNPMSKPILVVGDGISAADAIMHCLKMKLPVVHVFKRTEKQLKSTMLSRLSSTVYPEYSTIFDLMIGRTDHPLYTKLSNSTVHKILPNSSAEIHRAAQMKIQEIAYRCMVICVGLRTELSMLEDKYNFQEDYTAAEDASLYGIGSVVGDHFVRYLIGGAFFVAQNLQKQHRADLHASGDSISSIESKNSIDEEKPSRNLRVQMPQLVCRWLKLPCRQRSHSTSTVPPL